MESESTFSVTYQVQAHSKSEAQQIAEQICVEQTVEIPLQTLSENALQYVGTLKGLTNEKENNWHADIEYNKRLIGEDITQFINVLFGNSSLQPGIRVLNIEDTVLSELTHGPAFGIHGIRKLLNVRKRALSCTALKPVGLHTSELAERAYLFSSGGIDIIKDDHGLTNQESSPFRARIAACVRAVRKGEQNSGKRTLYFPNITTSPSIVFHRFDEAMELGADGVLISPQLAGLEIMYELAEKSRCPIMAHPAFSGSYTIHPTHGIAPELYYGKIWRSLGADAVIYPNTGGRFEISEQTCRAINDQLRAKLDNLNPSFPVPAGGIDRQNISKWISKYGNETILLIGGSLYLHPEGIKNAASEFQKILTDYEQ